jgi:hypothetical protein
MEYRARFLQAGVPMEIFHLLPNGGCWNLTPEGSNRPLATFNTKEEAIASAGRFFGEQAGSLKILREDGTVEEERAYPTTAAETGIK